MVEPPVWRNWSGAVVAHPRRVVVPDDEAQVQAAVEQAAHRGEPVRVVGSGHSFTPLCATEGTLLVLDALHGVRSVDTAARRAWVGAGSKLSDLGEELFRHGLAMPSLGDIDRQTLAGAIATGTHGTGRTVPNLSAAVVGARLVTADGGLHEVGGADADLLRAARVSLGALGVLTAVQLQLVDSFRLHERTWVVPAATALAELEEHIAAHRHFEFFWDPLKDKCLMKSLDPTEAPPNPMPERPYERVDHSHRVFPSIREQRFNEIEYALPYAAGSGCFAELRRLMRRDFTAVAWPLEYRTVAPDDAFLSPAEGQPVVTVSAHQAAGLPHSELFAAVERLCRQHGGRPHWGKWHSLGAAQLAGLYPSWDRFSAVRRRLDPDARFLTPYTRELLEG